MITHRFGLTDAAQAFEVVARPGNALKVVLFPEDDTFSG